MAPGKGDRWDGDADREGGAGVVEKTDQKLKKPQLYKVLLHNDDYTTMEFVVMVLMTVFHHGQAEAVRIMLQVHHEGIGVAGVYGFEVAETKAARVIALARHDEYPLQCSVEPA